MGRVVYAISWIIGLIIFIGGNCVAIYALHEIASPAHTYVHPGQVVFSFFTCVFVSWIVAPLMICATRVACEWEIMMFDWIVETTKAARIFVEENKTKIK